jgi:aldose 1-epimerase
MIRSHFITIASARSQCVIAPDIGGSIVSWQVDGQDMFRNADPEAVPQCNPLLMASFPLVPYSNRIGNAEFEWDHQTHALATNFHPEPHAIHGVGWQRSWRIAELTADRCILALLHDPDDCWPWPFEARQEILLDNGTLYIHSYAVNLSDRVVPLAFGNHPYFDMDGATLMFAATSVLMNGDDALPQSPCPPFGQYDFSQQTSVAKRKVDNCYSGWDGTAQISWAGRNLALEISSDLEAAVVYIPGDEDAFCFEPVPHANNAINRPDLSPQMPIVEPAGRFESTLLLRAVHADA